MAGRIDRAVFACLSDVGRVRANNEDAFGAFPKAGIWCVADGMGGGDDGEVASAETVASVAAFADAPGTRETDTQGAVAGVCQAVSAASQAIFDRAREKGLSGCGSTFVGLVLGREPGSPAHALHAGDSRLYRLRGGVVRCITRDHSFAAAAGARTDEQVNPMFRNMILRAVGIERAVRLDDMPFECRPGDRVILCSDGLSRQVADADFASLTRGLSAAAAVRTLVEAANAAGGEDNVTVVVVDVPRRRNLWRVALGAFVAWVLLAILLLAAHHRPSRPSEGGSPTVCAEDALLRAARQMEREAAARMKAAHEELECR